MALVPPAEVNGNPLIAEIDMGADSSAPTVVHVTVVQASTVFYDTPATLDKAERFVAEAAGCGAQLVVFPEAFVGGYPRGCNFGGGVILSRTEKGKEDFRKYHAAAINVPGPEVDRLAAMAGKYKVFLVMGVIERDGYTLYCTVLFFDSQGCYLGKHRKIMPTASERIIWGFGDGSTIPVFETPIGKIGAVICWENKMPLLRTAMYAKGWLCWPGSFYKDAVIGIPQFTSHTPLQFAVSREELNAYLRSHELHHFYHADVHNRLGEYVSFNWTTGIEIYCAPTADSRDIWQASMAHIASEGGCFVLSANQFCQRKDFPPPPEYVFTGREEELTPDSVVCRGGSVIMSPSGTVLAGPNYDGEALISADLDLGEIAREKFGFDVVGHFSRPEVLSLIVRDHPTNPVTFTSASAKTEVSNKS